jgi:lysozyme
VARKKKRFSSIYLFKIFFWFALACVAVYYVVTWFTEPSNIFYPDFQIAIPGGYKIHGIDVSKYQSAINWKEVKDMDAGGIKIGFVFIKATEGVGNVDNQFRRNWVKAEEQSICKGAYHFFIAGKSGRRQAANFIEIVNLKKGDLPPVIDIEKTFGVSANEIRKEVAEWLSVVEKYYNVRPVIYTNIDFYCKYLQDNFDDYPIWIAHYLQPVKPRIDHKWMFWQHSESGRVNGIKAPVDFNVFSGDSTDFRNFLIQ